MNFVLNPTSIATPSVGERRIDASRGTSRADVSRQWASRRADERFLSLNDLFEATNRRRENAQERTIRADHLRFTGTEENPESLTALLPDGSQAFPSNYAFGQLCSLGKMGKATEIFRSQPSWLAGLNLSHGLSRNVRDLPTKLLIDGDARELRAATGPDYGRIYDASLVDAIRKFAGNGTGDTAWKVPGCINWSTQTYNPWVDITSETTTLFASDRDVFVFLCDDTHPIEIGKLPNGDPDLVFRGFYAWNSEVGNRSLGIATFFLRGVCQNRCLWGVENFEELRIVHSKYGADRFARSAEPALARYAASEPTKLLAGIQAAKAARAADSDEEAVKFLTADSLGFSLKRAQQILETVEREEGHSARSAWDMVQGITAVARTIPNTDQRLEVEKVASKVMDRATRNL